MVLAKSIAVLCFCQHGPWTRVFTKFTGRQHGPCSRVVSTGAREHGPRTRVMRIPILAQPVAARSQVRFSVAATAVNSKYN